MSIDAASSPSFRKPWIPPSGTNWKWPSGASTHVRPSNSVTRPESTKNDSEIARWKCGSAPPARAGMSQRNRPNRPSVIEPGAVSRPIVPDLNSIDSTASGGRWIAFASPRSPAYDIRSSPPTVCRAALESQSEPVGGLDHPVHHLVAARMSRPHEVKLGVGPGLRELPRNVGRPLDVEAAVDEDGRDAVEPVHVPQHLVFLEEPRVAEVVRHEARERHPERCVREPGRLRRR